MGLRIVRVPALRAAVLQLHCPKQAFQVPKRDRHRLTFKKGKTSAFMLDRGRIFGGPGVIIFCVSLFYKPNSKRPQSSDVAGYQNL